MRFGCCLNMISTQPDGTGIEFIEQLKDAGFDYVELPTAQMMQLSDEDFSNFRKRVMDSGIPCETSNNCFPVTMRLTGEGVDMNEIRRYAEKAFRRDASLGVQYVVFGSGPAKNIPKGFPRDKAYDQVVSMLHMISPIASGEGITIVIEPLRRAECNMINTFEEGVELAKAVNDPNVRVLVDFYHLDVEKEPVSHIKEYGKEYLRHVHLANPAGRIYPADVKEAAYEPFFEALKDAEYDQRVSCEAYLYDSFGHDAPAAREFFRKLGGR